jgi:peptidoglycan/LPS O-acetylase OafA/YrhL
MPPGAPRFPLVDALRGLAALAIVGTHVAVFAGADYPGSPLGRYAQRLEVGVAVFFVISGFLLYRPYLAARLAAEPPLTVHAYAWRRFLRIVPGYWVALTVSAFALSEPGFFSPTYYLFGQTYRTASIGGGLVQAWTLCIEVTFYAFLPIWAWAMARVAGRSLRREAVALGAMAVLSLAYKAVLLAGMDPHQITITPLLLALPAYLDQFALGMGLAVLSVWLVDRASVPGAVRLLERRPGVAWAVAAVAFWVASTQIGIGDRLFEPFTPAQYMTRHLLYAVIGIAVVIPAVIGPPGRGVVRRVLAHPVLVYIGVVSYGLFLWHVTGLSLLERWGFRGFLPIHPYVAWAVAGVAFGVLLATVSWYVIERPALRLKRLLPRAPARRAAPPPPRPAEPAARAPRA